jgi:hypothetical protein
MEGLICSFDNYRLVGWTGHFVASLDSGKKQIRCMAQVPHTIRKTIYGNTL